MFYSKNPKSYVLRIKVIPNSSRCGFSGILNGGDGEVYLKINLHAVPEKGRANKELIAFLSKTLKKSKSSFSIINGETDRNKKILLETETSELLEEKLKQLENTNDSSTH